MEVKMIREGASVIPTRFGVSSVDEVLEKNIEELGGFPVVVKNPDENHGRGVALASSIDEVRAVASEMGSGEVLVLRKFIKNARHVKCTVLRDKVLDVIEYLPVEGGFRTNAVKEPRVRPFEYDEKVFEVARAALRADVVEFGGVDVLIDESGRPYVAEMNFPCNFSKNRMCTGVDIAEIVVDYLVSKANQDFVDS